MTRRSFALTPLATALLAADTPPTSLFNGTSLDGWTIREGPESAFYVKDGAIVIHEGSNFPTWLRSQKQYENFDFECEVFIKGWANSGIYIHAPEHGRNTWCGIKINLFHQQDTEPRPESMGAVFPLIAPSKVNVKNKGEWNSVRIRMDWPKLDVWVNGEQVQNVNVDQVPELRYRLRSGYLGLESLSYPLAFRNLRIRELPSKVAWETLYDGPTDLEKWEVAEGKATWETLGRVLRADNMGYLATKKRYQNFAFQTYIRGSRYHNGGIIFRAEGTNTMKHYEIQLHDVEGAVYPTGSLYHFKRATYPRILPEEWYLFQLFVENRDCLVRINGDTVVDYHTLDRLMAGPLMLQAHQANRWIEYKEMKIRPL